MRYRGVPVGRVSESAWIPLGNSIEIDFEMFLRPPHDHRRQCQADPGSWPSGGAFSKTARSGGGQPRDRRGLPVARSAGKPAAADDARVHAGSGVHPVDAHLLSKVRDRLPEVLERAELTLQNLREIVARIPDSLDRSDRFFTNIERIIHESELPALSADSRKFFTTTSTQLAQIERITTELDRLIESQEAFAKFVEETRATINAADLPATTQSARDSAERTSLAADDLRRSLPAMRDSLEEMRQLARFLGEQPESVIFGPRSTGGKSK